MRDLMPRRLATGLAVVIAASVVSAVLFATTPAHAAGGLTGVDAMTATVFQEGQSSFSGLGIRFRLHDKRLLENVEFMPTVEYWRNSSKIEAFDLSTVRRDAALGADVRWMFPGEAWRAYFGGGMSVHFLSDKVDAPRLGLNDRTDSLTKGGLTLIMGAAFGTKSKLGNFVEVKGHLVGGYRQLKINLGLSWNH